MKFYTKPELEISLFSTEDIITVSGGSTSNDDATTDTDTGLTESGALTETASDATYSELFS